MESLSSPLVDFFRRGEAPREVRLIAAQGAFAPRPLDQLSILVVLTGDGDPDIQAAAETTLTRIPTEVLSGFLARSDVSDDLRAFFKDRGVSIASVAAADQAAPFVDEDD